MFSLWGSFNSFLLEANALILISDLKNSLQKLILLFRRGLDLRLFSLQFGKKSGVYY